MCEGVMISDEPRRSRGDKQKYFLGGRARTKLLNYRTAKFT